MTAGRQSPPVPRASATTMLLRDGARGLEVFMVKRHHRIDFASGALVFPGGKLDPGDRDPAVAARCDGADAWPGERLGYAVTAIREAFEECGILLARPRGGRDLIAGPRLATTADRYRARMAAGEVALVDMLRDEDLVLACDLLVLFAHWVTPVVIPKRFETLFFLVAADDRTRLVHDGLESVDSLWVRPADALASAASGDAVIVFPTRLNLERLGASDSVAAAMSAAARAPVVTIEPEVVKTDAGMMLRIPAGVGYRTTEGPVDPVLKKMKPRA